MKLHEILGIPDFVQTPEDLEIWLSMEAIGGSALLGTFVDTRTSTAITSGNSATFAHGIGLAPDVGIVVPNASLASSTNWWNCYALVDATNVTMHNSGGANTPAVLAVTIRFHSIVR